MAQFVVLLHDDPAQWRKMAPADLQAAFSKYGAWGRKGREDGYVVAGNKLTDEPGKVIRGKKPVTDGPYSETKEVVGGYYIIEAASYDEAVRRLDSHPHREYGGTLEIRQIEVLPA